MDILFQLALIIIPAGAVLFTAVFFMRKFSERQVNSVNLELKKERQTFFLPNRVSRISEQSY